MNCHVSIWYRKQRVHLVFHTIYNCDTKGLPFEFMLKAEIAVLHSDKKNKRSERIGTEKKQQCFQNVHKNTVAHVQSWEMCLFK